MARIRAVLIAAVVAALASMSVAAAASAKAKPPKFFAQITVMSASDPDAAPALQIVVGPSKRPKVKQNTKAGRPQEIKLRPRAVKVIYRGERYKVVPVATDAWQWAFAVYANNDKQAAALDDIVGETVRLKFRNRYGPYNGKVKVEAGR